MKSNTLQRWCQLGEKFPTKGLGSYTAKLALERRGGNGDDLLSVLGNAKLGDRYLTEGEPFHNGWLYILGGLIRPATRSRAVCSP